MRKQPSHKWEENKQLSARWLGIRKNRPRPMDVEERGSWIDTEGSISAFLRKSGRWKGSFVPNIHIVQMERAPLEDYRAGALKDGVRCCIVYNRASGAYHAIVSGIKSVDREIRLTRKIIRTANKWSQIRRFYRMATATKHRRKILLGYHEH